jgi:DNA-binding MarR family transcriptional regulator
MHDTNVVTAWIVSSHDALAAAASTAGSGLRELAALTLVASHEGCSGEWLRARIGLTQSGAVRLVDRLQADGLLVRSTRSGRAIRLTATAEGHATLERWHAARNETLERLTAGLDGQQIEQLASLLASALVRQPRARVAADTACRGCDWPACGSDCPVDRSVPDDVP